MMSLSNSGAAIHPRSSYPHNDSKNLETFSVLINLEGRHAQPQLITERVWLATNVAAKSRFLSLFPVIYDYSHDWMANKLHTCPLTIFKMLKVSSMRIDARYIQVLKGAASAVAAIFFVSKASADCNKTVKLFRTNHLEGTTLCDLQSRYKSALDALQKQRIQNPTHAGNIFATRFIKKTHWNSYLNQHGDSEFAAWRVYTPAPTTWGNWAKSAELVARPQTKNLLKTGSVANILALILTLHNIAMHSLLPPERVGTYRTDVAEIIPLHFADNAYAAADIEMIRRIPYVSPKTREKLMRFELRLCNDRPPSANEYYFNDKTDGTLKACGDLTMVPQEEVLEQMGLWAQYLRSGLQNLTQNPGSFDPIEFAAIVQQWFVVIHPFVDGNGRLSRLMMDLVLSQFGLPAPILDDMDRDFFSTPQEWADLVGRGIVNSVEAIEACAKTPSLMGCRVVSPTAPPMN